MRIKKMKLVIANTRKKKANWFLWSAPKGIPIMVCTEKEFRRYGIPDKVDGIVVTSIEGLKHLLTLVREDDIFWERGSPYTHNSLLGMFNTITTHTGRKIDAAYSHSIAAMNSPMSGHVRVMYNRIMRKFLPNPNKNFIAQHPVEYTYLDGDFDYIQKVEKFGKPLFLACDLETLQNVIVNYKGKEKRFFGVIDIASWSAVYLINGEYKIKTWVVPMRKKHHHTRFKELMEWGIPKVWHNGNYDKAYLLRWRIVPINSIWDTQYYPQSVTSDLKGFYNLAHQHALHCRYSKYWKGLANWKIDRTEDKGTYFQGFCRYSALDTHNGAELALTQMLQYNKQNLINFALKTQFIPVTTLATMENMFVNMETRFELAKEVANKKFAAMENTQKIFNQKYNSTKLVDKVKDLSKVAKMLDVPEVPKVSKADKLTLSMLKGANSYYDYILRQIEEARLYNNWMSTYISMMLAEDSKGRTVFMTAVGSYQTQSLRFNSSQSPFWIGTNAQNIPKPLRKMMEPPPGYLLGASDAPQSESYTTGYESNCKDMIDILENPDIDWHKNTAHVCFGVPYDEVIPAMRKDAKPVGHGFNYNMKAYALLMNMGLDNARRARDTLGFDPETPLVKVCGHLINSLSNKFYIVRNHWYLVQANKVVLTGRLKCSTGLAPLILQDIQFDTKVLNSVVSLAPQHVSAYINTRGALSAALYQIYRDDTIRYLLQIHDENVFMIPEDMSIREADQFFLDHFSNKTSYPASDKGFLSIPVGIPVYGNNWGDLNLDEIERENLDLDAPISRLTPKSIEEHGLPLKSF